MSNPFSLTLSALICLSFSFSSEGQNQPAPLLAPQPESPAKQQQNAIARQLKAIAFQQESVERQRARFPSLVIAAPRFTQSNDTSEPVQPASAFGCAPIPPMLLQSVVHNAATTYDIAPDLIHAVIRQESGGYPCAVSGKGAMGLMQLMPATALELGATEPFDVDQNVAAGTRLLAELMQRYKGDLNRVLGAYNAGPGAVDRAGGPPPFPETINYIHSILRHLNPAGDSKLFASPVR
jgi:soluble lytic murein transglycosylase-like protein